MSGKYLNKEQVKQQEQTRRTAMSATVKLAIVLVIIAVVLLNIFTHFIQVVNYRGSGMEPSLHNGEILVLQKTQKVKEGDIIAFYYNNQVLVRRVISTGGKQLSIAQDGTVSVNGIVQEEKYLENLSLGQCNIDFPYHVRTGYVFVMGDNRETAMDSRLKEIGLIPAGRIIGKVIFTI